MSRTIEQVESEIGEKQRSLFALKQELDVLTKQKAELADSQRQQAAMERCKSITIESVVDRLNYRFKDDPTAMKAMLLVRVPTTNVSLDRVVETCEPVLTLLDVLRFITSDETGRFILLRRNQAREIVGFELSPPGCVQM